MSNYHNIEEHVPVEKDELFFTPTSKSLDWAIPALLAFCLVVSLLYACCIVKKAMRVPRAVTPKINTDDDSVHNKLFVAPKVKKFE